MEKKQKELESCLIDLSKKSIDDSEEQQYIRRLRSVYTEGFRHSYSKFYSLVENIDKEGGLTFLLDNIDKIKVATEKSEKDKDFSLKIFKLADHLNLEIARYDKNSKTDAERDNLKTSVENVKNTLINIKSDIKNTKNETENIIETARKEVNNIKTDIIAIIGIFSGIVLAFSGYMQSFAEAFKSINQAPPSKLTFFILLTGLVLFDIIYSMFYIIGKLLDRTIKISLKHFFWFNIAVMAMGAVILNYGNEIKVIFDKIFGLA